MKKYILFIILVVVLAGCGSLTYEEQLEAQFYATQYAKDPNNIPPVKYQTLAAEHYGVRFAVATATPSPNYNFTPTMNFYDFSGTQVAQQHDYQMTADAQKLQVEQARLDAEARAQREAEEAKRAQETAVAYSHQQTAEARVFYGNQTAAAQGTAMMATAQFQATATMWQFQIDQQNTAAAAVATNQVLPTHALWTQEAVYGIQTVEAGEAEKVELAVKRQQAKNYLDAFLPWGIILALAYVGGRGFVTYVKMRTHPRDEHGRPQTLTRELPDGGVVIVKTELLESGIAKIAGDGSIVRYAPMDKQEQSDINRRAQAIEAIAALPVPYASKGPQLLAGEFGRSAPRVNFSESQSLSPVLEEADDQFLDGNHE